MLVKSVNELGSLKSTTGRFVHDKGDEQPASCHIIDRSTVPDKMFKALKECEYNSPLLWEMCYSYSRKKVGGSKAGSLLEFVGF